MALAFNPLSLLNLKCRGRTIAVLRDECQHYDSVLAVARRKFRSLHGVPVEDIVLLATIPGYPETDQVELSKEIWPTVSAVVHSVTIVLESEMRTTTEGAGPSPSLPDYQEILLPAAPPSAPLAPAPAPAPAPASSSLPSQ
ncbi:hypothetical protein BC826DRAFT_1105524 [Russula brevipes]|nr:hypothetical protein BC826DRAFT_1105524 [Russula brevipes]